MEIVTVSVFILGLLVTTISFFLKESFRKLFDKLDKLECQSHEQQLSLSKIEADKEGLLKKLAELEVKITTFDKHILDFYKDYKYPLEIIKNHTGKLQDLLGGDH
jgi:predicted  nucleic acid-binding Zn-ribbon protein